MNEFEFSPAHNFSYLRDVAEVLAGLEKAKTAMRAMSKYVPVNLVRQLYQKGEEPVLGGKSAELSVLFTDIKDFTTFAESIPPGELAEVLGRYLQAMAEAIQGEKGTIDKYIGDAVMTFWNAPEPVAGHEILACRAALCCQEALQKLYDSPHWGNAPRFETRFGLHRCVAMVGHFGAPDRLNYTAIGDGINLTSRLEGLNKHYGTHIIASESIHAAAKDAFEFRLLDRVAVKGKTEGIVIYELLAGRLAGKPRPQFIERYEQAFAAYQRGDFAAALGLLDGLDEDLPGRILAGRCREFLNHPPINWNGIHVFDSK
jgi:adenylate cyclase